MRIIVLDGEQRSALATVRSLSRAGHSVYVASSAENAVCKASRYATAFFNYPNPSDNYNEALEAIRDYVSCEGVDLVFPITDVTTHMLLSSQKLDQLPPLPCPPLTTYEHASDKGRLADTARQTGVAIPRTLRIDQNEPLQELPAGFTFPVVLKPTRSRIAIDGGYLSTMVMIAQNKAQFLTIQQQNRWFLEAPWLLQAFIEGTGQGVFAIYDHGRPVAWFAHERIREKPPTGGVSVLSRSAPLSRPLKSAAEALLDKLKWHGPAMVEFRVAADGTPYLMEINARFWGSLQLAISSGVNFPVLAAQIALGERPPEVTSYKLGVYNRWLLGDLDNLYLTLKAPLSQYSAWQKLKAAGRFMIPWWPGLHYEVNQWGDMGPFWHELKNYLR